MNGAKLGSGIPRAVASVFGVAWQFGAAGPYPLRTAAGLVLRWGRICSESGLPTRGRSAHGGFLA
jgi:hypothetical protein